MERPAKRFQDLTDFVREALLLGCSAPDEIAVRTGIIRRRSGDVTLEVTAAGDGEELRVRVQQAADLFLADHDITQGMHQQSTQPFTVSRVKIHEPRSVSAAGLR